MRAVLVKFSPGVAHFYRGSDFNGAENRLVTLASRLQPITAWGRRAEDPFRGLRAGPVRSSPHFFAYPPAGKNFP